MDEKKDAHPKYARETSIESDESSFNAIDNLFNKIKSKLIVKTSKVISLFNSHKKFLEN
jgi:hypothetical protein